MAALVFRRRVDHAGDMTARAEDKSGIATEQVYGPVGALPRDDVVLTRAVDKAWQADCAQIDRHAAIGHCPRFTQPITEVGVAHIPAIHRTGQIGAVGVPVQQIERRRRLAFEVIADHIRPDEIVRSQRREHEGELRARQNAALADGLLAHLKRLLIDHATDLAGVGKIEHRGQVSGARNEILAFRFEHSERSPEQRAAHTEAQRIDLVATGYVMRDAKRLDHASLDIVVPAQMTEIRLYVAPRDHEHGMTFGYRVGDVRVFRLQIENVELVDARRHHHERALGDRRGGRCVLYELKEFVLVHHRARRGGDVAADFERRFVGLADVTLARIFEKIYQAPREALAVGVDCPPDCLGVGRREIGRTACIDELTDRESQALFCRRLGLYALHQFIQITRCQQIRLLQIIVIGIFAPFGGPEPLVSTFRRDHRIDCFRAAVTSHHRGPELHLPRRIL